jgi:Fur family ferric uptake transcriptional regulator
MQKLIDEFNARDNGIRVEVKNYAEEEDLKDFGIDEKGVFNGYDTDELKTIDFRVTQDLLNKDTIDLVGPFSFGNGAKYEIFKQRGGFCDLYEFMKDDPEVTKVPGESSIYRLIKELVESGEVKRTVKGNSRNFVYQITGGESCHHHLHMKCISCGKLYHMNDEESRELMERIFKEEHFELDSNAVLPGRCEGCK